MQDHIFRAYDIRGIVDSELLISEVYTLARAIAFYCIEKNPYVKTIAVGMDGRIHSLLIKDEIVRAFLDSGLDVIFVGQCTTPVLYFSSYWLPVQAGMMVTASHNPKEYNGIKIVLGKKSVAQDEILRIRDYYKTKKQHLSVSRGSVHEYDLVSEYTAYLVRLFPHLSGFKHPIIFDCANSVAALVIPKLIQALGFKKAELLYDTLDGTYPNHNPDPSTEKNIKVLREKVLQQDALCGIAFDGDADRMGVVTRKGTFVAGDKLLAFLSEPVVKACSGAGVVYDGKCSSGLKELIERWGGVPCISPTGHSFIKQTIEREGALVAGELSCHFFFKDRYFGFDDGIYAALRLCERLQDQTVSLFDDFLDAFPHRVASPELRIACPLLQGPVIVNAARLFFEQQEGVQLSTLDGVRVEKKYGWGMLRASQTESVICMRLESFSKEGLEVLKEDFRKALMGSYPLEFLNQVLSW